MFKLFIPVFHSLLPQPLWSGNRVVFVSVDAGMTGQLVRAEVMKKLQTKYKGKGKMSDKISYSSIISFIHGRMARGGHGLPKVSPGPTNALPFYAQWVGHP
jgi:hypothetical protein